MNSPFYKSGFPEIKKENKGKKRNREAKKK